MRAPRGLTAYQLEILQHLQRASAAEPLDFDQLIGALSWTPSKESAQFSFRALTAKGLIAKSDTLYLRRGRKRICYVLTDAGICALDPRATPPAAPKGKATPPDGGKLAPEIEVTTDFLDAAIFAPGVPESVEALPFLEDFSIEE